MNKRIKTNPRSEAAISYFAASAGYPGSVWRSGAFARLEDAVAVARSSENAAAVSGDRAVSLVSIEPIQPGREAAIRHHYLWSWTDESPWREAYEQWMLGPASDPFSFEERADADPEQLRQAAEQIVAALGVEAESSLKRADLLAVTLDADLVPTADSDRILAEAALRLMDSLPGQLPLETASGEVSRDDYWRERAADRKASFAAARARYDANTDLSLPVDLERFSDDE